MIFIIFYKINLKFSIRNIIFIFYFQFEIKLTYFNEIKKIKFNIYFLIRIYYFNFFYTQQILYF